MLDNFFFNLSFLQFYTITMNRLSIAFLLFAGFSFANAQKYDILWGESDTQDYGFTVKTYPKFTNPGYETDGKNVYVNVKGVRSGSYQITNLVWEKADRKSLMDLEPLLLPDHDFSSVTYYNHPAENQEYYSARVAAYKFTGGTLYRLSSFEVTPAPDRISARQYKLAAKMGTAENPLKSGTFFKIKVDKSGVFKITKKFLADNGINVANLNPKNFRIYGNGGLMLPEAIGDERYAALQENAIQVTGEEDGKWDDGDYALFYAQGPHGFNVHASAYNESRAARTDTRDDRSLHFQNIYDDFAYYFINFDLGPGKRILQEDAALPPTLISRYDDYQFIDEEKSNLLKIGRVWVGDAFNNDKKITFNVRTPLQPGEPVYYRTSVVANNAQNNSIKFDINGVNGNSAIIPNTEAGFIKLTGFSGTATGLSGNTVTITAAPNIAANPTGGFYFDYAEILYKQDLTFNDAQMNFRDYSLNSQTGLFGFSLSNSAAVEQVWDVSDITNVKQKVNKSGTAGIFSFGFQAKEHLLNEFVAFKNSAAYVPTFVGRIENQDLSGLQNIDYLIITQPQFLADAKRLADHHQEKNQYHVAVVDVNKIYNEFSSGSKDITAIRDFAAKLKNERGGLKFLTILGDSSYDFRNRTKTHSDIIPSYQSEDSGNFVTSFVNDDYFGTTSATQSPYFQSNLPDIPVGRLPAANAAESKLLTDKTLAYYNALPGQSSPFGEWRMKLDFVVDDDADGGGPFHDIMNRVIVENFESGKRGEYNVKKLYLDAFLPEVSSGGQRYPQVNQAISNDVGNSLYLFYFGHGGISGWAQERVLTLDEIRNFNNFNSAYSRFPLISTITCEFTLWDNPEVQSAGEQAIKHKNGGAATMITSSRAVSVGYGRAFTDTFTKNIFEFRQEDNEFYTLGESFLRAKKEHGVDPNHLRVNFLGDPAMALSRPKKRLSIDKIETPEQGKIRALDFVKVSGRVSKADGSVDENFNGRVVVNLFDKRLNKSTRNNDNTAAMLPLLKYTEEGSPIVKASGKAVNGNYTVEFYVPKDINYALGQGRMLLYADNFASAKSNAYDVYHNQNVTVGEINPNGISDDQPPKINLFMNNTNFADGGITDQNPMLLACVTDNTGINSTGSGIGHDITVVLDGQVINTVVLNDFFSSGETNGCVNTALSDYQKGSVTYPFRNLAPGPHQLVFKVWDINNNSSTATLNFTVKDESDQKLALNRLLNWPNPFTDKTYIQFEHNCDDILDVNVQIYTITGKLVRTLSQPVMAEPFLQGYRTPRLAIEWDGKDDFGSTVGKGTYIFKVHARSQNQDKCKGGATAIEKMVLLK